MTGNFYLNIKIICFNDFYNAIIKKSLKKLVKYSTNFWYAINKANSIKIFLLNLLDI